MVRGLGSRQNAKPRTPCTTMTLVKYPKSQMTKSWTHLCLEVSLGLRRGILSPDRLELLCKVGLAHVALLRYRRHYLLACKARAFDRRLPANAGGGGVRWGPGRWRASQPGITSPQSLPLSFSLSSLFSPTPSLSDSPASACGKARLESYSLAVLVPDCDERWSTEGVLEHGRTSASLRFKVQPRLLFKFLWHLRRMLSWRLMAGLRC